MRAGAHKKLRDIVFGPYPWPFRCFACGCVSLTVTRHIDQPRTGKTTSRYICQCGFDSSVVGDTVDTHYSVPGGMIPRERIGHYEQPVCVYCKQMLGGRQKLYCGDRCRMRYNRTA